MLCLATASSVRHFEAGVIASMSSSMGSFVPENVKNFIHYFRRHVNEANVPGILSMYETMWP